ncbi:OmpA family protein [Mucilaginibacter sp.]
MSKYLALTLSLLITYFTSFAQEQLTGRQLADRAFERYEYARSLNLYLGLIGKTSYEVLVIERIADCYRLMNDDVNAEAWYSRLQNEPEASRNAAFYYAEALLHNHKFKEAKAQYTIYYQHFNAPQEIRQRLAACDSALAWMQKPAGYEVRNIKGLNSYESDWGAADFNGGVLFISERNTGDKGRRTDPRTGASYHQLYVFSGDSVSSAAIFGQKSVIKVDKSRLNAKKFHIGPAVLNAAGDTAYITLSAGQPAARLPVDAPAPGSSQRLYTRRLQLVMAVRRGNRWGGYQPFAYNNPGSYSVGHAALSANGQVLYFTSDRPGGEGGTDIWYCEKQPGGTWGPPVNCGRHINTPADEAFPALHGGTLYFASKGWPGMGGYDLFAASGAKNQWATPRNLRYPANSTRDDFYLTTTNGHSGYLSSNRGGGMGSDDIYSFSYTPPAVTAQVPEPVTPPAGNTPPVSATTGPAPLAIIYYNLDQSAIRADAAVELDKLLPLLRQRPLMRLELASYTDARAPAVYNMALSARRSVAAAAYLSRHGIAPQRLVLRSYGETRLVNHCPNGVSCTEAQQQLNRRTEVREVID